jgi:hypothetical protein
MGKTRKPDRADELADALASMAAGAGDDASQRAPSASTEEQQDAPQDMTMSAPPPDVSVFAPTRSTAELLAERRLRAQRTAIPVMLTCGVLLPAIGCVKWIAADDSVFAQWGLFMPFALAGAGALCLVVAVINMMQVRDALRRQSDSRRHGGD